MQKINLVVLEDDSLFQLKLENMLNDTEFRILKMFESPTGLEDYVANTGVDLILSDLFIGTQPEGIALIKSLHKTNLPIVCMTSSQEDKIYDEIDEFVAGYLIKPFHKITLLSILRNIIKENNKNQLYDFLDKKYLMLTGKSGKLEKINLSDIIHLEASGNYTIIVTKKAKYAKKISMSKLIELELDNRFRRIHSKYTINSQMLKSITSTSLTLINDQVYKISRNFKKNIKDF